MLPLGLALLLLRALVITMAATALLSMIERLVAVASLAAPPPVQDTGRRLPRVPTRPTWPTRPILAWIAILVSLGIKKNLDVANVVIDGRSGRGTTGSGLTGSNTTGAGYGSSGYGSTTAGPHSSNLANKADPRVDSDLGKFFMCVPRVQG